MATTIGMGAKKKNKKEDNKKVSELNVKVVKLQKEKAELIKEVEELQKEKAELNAKIIELEKANSN